MIQHLQQDFLFAHKHTQITEYNDTFLKIKLHSLFGAFVSYIFLGNDMKTHYILYHHLI